MVAVVVVIVDVDDEEGEAEERMLREESLTTLTEEFPVMHESLRYP